MQVQMTEAGGFFLHEEGVFYPGTIVALEPTEGDYGPGIKWILNLDGDFNDDGTPRDTWAFSSAKLSTKTKLYSWLKAIWGADWQPQSGTAVPLDDLVGTRVDVKFEVYQGFDSGGNPVEKDKVIAIRKHRPQAGAADGKITQLHRPATPTADDAPF